MARDYSLVLFGATGFTGKFVLKELLDCHADQKLDLPIAVAGRSSQKLQQLLSDLNSGQRIKVIPNVDITDQDSINRMCSSSRLVLNVVGPYRLYGEPVVRACAESGTDYLDVCGEPEFIERMEAKYHERASASGCRIACAAGFDSVPGDFGTVLVQQEFLAPSVPSCVEAYLAVSSGPHGYLGHFATWQSAVLGIASVGALRALRASRPAPAIKPLGPKPRPPSGIEFIKHSAVRSFSVPFPGADASVVRRTQARLQASGRPPVHFTARFLIGSRYYAYLTAVVGLIMGSLAKVAWGRFLLLRFPSLFSMGTISHAGPSQRQIETTKCITTLVARGYTSAPEQPGAKPDREVVLRITGPDPGYKATAIFLAQAGLSLLLDREKLPASGVHTVGSLFVDTDYASRLRSRGITIEKVRDGPPSAD